ncbi:MAG: hypothetical protein EXS60_01925 [Candidatus Pacebacteria bacterium]|nr:hypothetical protein [Candidatus Paceibacterota bacterium]
MSIPLKAVHRAIITGIFVCIVFGVVGLPSYVGAQASSAKLMYTTRELDAVINSGIAALRGNGTAAYMGYINNLDGSDTEARRHNLNTLAAALTPLIQNAKALADALEKFKKTPLLINDEGVQQADIAKRLGEIRKKADETKKSVDAVLAAINTEQMNLGFFDGLKSIALNNKRTEIVSAQSFLVNQMKALDNMIKGSIVVPMPKPPAKPPMKPMPPPVDELPPPEKPPKSPFGPAEPSEPEPVDMPPVMAMPMPKTEREARAALATLNEMIKELEKQLADLLAKKNKK